MNEEKRTFVAEDIKAIIEGLERILDIYEKIVHRALMPKYTIEPIEFDRETIMKAAAEMIDEDI